MGGGAKVVDAVVQGTKAASKTDAAVRAAQRGADANAQRARTSLADAVADHNASIVSLGVEQERALAKAQLREMLTEQEHATRETALFDPTVEIKGAGHGTQRQTLNAEEYTRRYRDQLQDPVYSVKNTAGRMDSNLLDDVIKGQLKHNKEVERIFGKLSLNQRWRSNYDSWVGESAYKDQMYFHVEKYTDPTRPAGDFIQFYTPREMGVHGGTSSAANRLIGFGTIDEVNAYIKSLNDSMDEIAGLSGIDRKILNKHINRELDAHFLRKFKGEGTLGDMTSDEWKGLINRVQDELGAEGGAELNRAYRLLKEAPMPNATPMVFRGQNGLLLQDKGNFRPDTVLEQLRDIFPNDPILATMGGNRQELTKKLQDFIESKGFDHIVYHNDLEDKGNLSIINWNPDLQKSVWDMAEEGPQGQAKAAAQAFMAVMGIGVGADATIRD